MRNQSFLRLPLTNNPSLLTWASVSFHTHNKTALPILWYINPPHSLFPFLFGDSVLLVAAAFLAAIERGSAELRRCQDQPSSFRFLFVSLPPQKGLPGSSLAREVSARRWSGSRHRDTRTVCEISVWWLTCCIRCTGIVAPPFVTCAFRPYQNPMLTCGCRLHRLVPGDLQREVHHLRNRSSPADTEKHGPYAVMGEIRRLCMKMEQILRMFSHRPFCIGQAHTDDHCCDAHSPSVKSNNLPPHHYKVAGPSFLWHGSEAFLA
ncbi:hypothetical protein B0H67DRAFT_321749 [Lasiosphaeris hirsuta]|uniref:Uncharacterized protein n=1 Tax=Lasiosphaeris hirsuta TaxID=260670 RepID=A0AA40DNX4_9PEZI|nr:hypothetical protein B0H67DRAFT_321749 [Lasiosphaeris hirsuta]